MRLYVRSFAVPVRSPTAVTSHETASTPGAQSRLNPDAPTFFPMSGYYPTSHVSPDAIVSSELWFFVALDIITGSATDVPLHSATACT